MPNFNKDDHSLTGKNKYSHTNTDHTRVGEARVASSGNDGGSSRTDGFDYEFCPRCEANLTLQKGYRNDLPYWICRGCGEMLINPSVPGDIAWICDGCGEMLNIQAGFAQDCGTFICEKCGTPNRIDDSAVYLSDEEYQADAKNPQRGLSDEAVLALSEYTEEDAVSGRENILLVRSRESGRLYVKKILDIYDRSVYEYLREHPVSHMPKICGVYESTSALIVIEEYIPGRTLGQILEGGPVDPGTAIFYASRILGIARSLHCQKPPIIHRDIKPSNVIVTPEGEVYLLDMNAAKWYREGETEDTRLLGTRYFAAPEQLGYGYAASSGKTDIYAIGVLLNVMVTGKLPKEMPAPKPLWEIVKRCTCLEPEGRYTDEELQQALDRLAE